jgi:hypothetical protein
MHRCLTIYKSINTSQLKAVQQFNSDLTFQDRIDRLNRTKDTAKKELDIEASYIMKINTSAENSELTMSHVSSLASIITLAKQQLDALAPTPCNAENDPAGCGGTGRTSEILAIFDEGKCDPSGVYGDINALPEK